MHVRVSTTNLTATRLYRRRLEARACMSNSTGLCSTRAMAWVLFDRPRTRGAAQGRPGGDRPMPVTGNGGASTARAAGPAQAGRRKPIGNIARILAAPSSARRGMRRDPGTACNCTALSGWRDHLRRGFRHPHISRPGCAANHCATCIQDKSYQLMAQPAGSLGCHDICASHACEA